MDKVRPIDAAIRQTELLLHFLKMAKQGNYPPAVYAQLMQGMAAHAQIKYHVDRESASQGAAWGRANRPDQIVPAQGKVRKPTPNQGSEPPQTITVAGNKIPVEAA